MAAAVVARNNQAQNDGVLDVHLRTADGRRNKNTAVDLEGREVVFEDDGYYGLINRLERATGLDIDGDGRLAESGGLKSGTRELARASKRAEVDLSGWFLHMRVNRLQGSGFSEQRLIMTEDVIAFEEGAEYDDVIALEDIASCQDLSKLANAQSSLLWSQGGPGLIAIYTEEGCHNAGRPYCFQILGPVLKDSKASARAGGEAGEDQPPSTKDPSSRFPVRETLTGFSDEWRRITNPFRLKNGQEVTLSVYETNRASNKGFRSQATFHTGNRGNFNEALVEWTEAFMQVMSVLGPIATKAKQERELSAFARSRLTARAIFHSLNFQLLVAALICANFASNAFEAEMNGRLVDEHGNPSATQISLNNADLFFTVVFTIELAINMYAHLLWEFLGDGWSLFDFLIVTISVTAVFSSSLANISVFRLMRAFRVIRIFGRLESVRSIINALTASIIPVCNAFFIVAIVLALFAIVGVTFFEEDAPEEFGNLSKSIISMFRIAGGETWAETMPTVYVREDGSEYVNWKFGCFIMLYVLVLNWTLLQVGVAVLLDNFVAETSREHDAAEQMKIEDSRKLANMSHVLDPVFKVIATDYVDEKDFDKRMRQLWETLVSTVVLKQGKVPRKGTDPIELNKEQVCLAFCELDFETTLHFSETDYNVITENGKLANANNCLGYEEFRQIMRSQMVGHIKRKLQRSVSETETQESFATLASIKYLLNEIDILRTEVDTARQEQKTQDAEIRSMLKAIMAATGASSAGVLDAGVDKDEEAGDRTGKNFKAVKRGDRGEIPANRVESTEARNSGFLDKDQNFDRLPISRSSTLFAARSLSPGTPGSFKRPSSATGLAIGLELEADVGVMTPSRSSNKIKAPGGGEDTFFMTLIQADLAKGASGITEAETAGGDAGPPISANSPP